MGGTAVRDNDAGGLLVVESDLAALGWLCSNGFPFFECFGSATVQQTAPDQAGFLEHQSTQLLVFEVVMSNK